MCSRKDANLNRVCRDALNASPLGYNLGKRRMAMRLYIGISSFLSRRYLDLYTGNDDRTV
jgi:hypothetical protein